jgi:hypothetical protein
MVRLYHQERRSRRQSLLTIGLFFASVLLPLSRNRSEAMITKIIIDSVQSPTFGGASFGEVGQYEKLVGRAFGELDPECAQ